MPITPAPDPQNPGGWIWVDSATGQPAVQPGGPGTPYVAPSDQPQAAQPTTQPAASAGPPSPGQGTTPALPPSIGAAQGAGGMYTVDQATETAAREVQNANVDVTKIWEQVSSAKKTYDDLQAQGYAANPTALSAAGTTLNSAYQTLSQAQQRVETANAAYSTALTSAIKLVDPNQVGLVQAQIAQADANAKQAGASAQVLVDGADTQKAKVAAEAAQASALAAQAQATADAQNAKTPYETQQLQAQAALYGQQANQISQLLPGLLAKQQADTTLTQHQVSLTDAQSDYYQAQGASAQADAALKQAQATLTTPAQAQLYGAQAQEAQANIQKGLLGPTYGLQDQINAIRSIQQQVFGPGGSGDPGEANDLLQQYTTAALSGTTPYAGAVAAANYGQNIYGTQAAMQNAAVQAAASRANAYTGLGGNVLSTLAGMNVNAPAGSTAGAAAFQDVMNSMAQRLQGPQFSAPAPPTPPALPPMLARYAQGAGAPMGPVGGAQPPPTAANSGAGSVNITVSAPPAAGGQSAYQMPGMNVGGMPGAGAQGQQSSQLPGVLQNYSPLSSMGDIGRAMSSIWGPELSSGAVSWPGT